MTKAGTGKYSYKVVLRKENVRKDGTSPLAIRLTINRKIKYYSLNKYIEAKDWDSEKGRAKKSLQMHHALNRLVDQVNSKTADALYELERNGKSITFQSFESVYFDDVGQDFYQFAIQHLNTIESRVSPGYIRKNRGDMNKLRRYAPELMISDIDLAFLRKFDDHMRRNLDNHSNTVAKTMKFVKLITNEALRQGKIKEDPFLHYRFEYKKTERHYLEMYEVWLLDEMLDNLNEEKLVNSLRIFLFACYTGLRYQDIKELSFN